jgi:hypothetical protein
LAASIGINLGIAKSAHRRLADGLQSELDLLGKTSPLNSLLSAASQAPETMSAKANGARMEPIGTISH